jgi:hypothetical protein
VESANESDDLLNSAISSSVIRGGQTSPLETFTSAKGGSPTNVGSNDSSTVGGFTALVYSKAEFSTQRLGRITTALSWPTFMRLFKYLHAIGKPHS